LEILRNIRVSPGEFFVVLRNISKELSLEPEEWKRVAILRRILQYLDRAREDADKFYDISVFQEVKEEYVTYLEKLENRGIEKGKLETAKTMLQKGLALDLVLEVTGLHLSVLQEKGLV